MKLGIIGPELSGKQIATHIHAISPEVETALYSRESSADALDVIQQCEAECDAILFTGPATCASVTQRHKILRAYDYVTKDSFSLMVSFKQMETAGLSVDNFSVDVVKPYIIDDACSEIGLSPQHVWHFPFTSFDEEEYIRWHQSLWEQGKTQAILTGFVQVYHHFQQLGMPVFYLPVSRFTVRAAFNRLMSRMELKEAQSAQIVVEIIEIDNDSGSAGNYYSARLRVCQTESFITEYCQKIEAAFFRSGQGQFIIFANRGGVKREENYHWLYMLQSQILKSGLHPNIGIGFGSTAYQAEIHANKALSYAKKEQGSYIYSISEDGTLSGPLGSVQSISYNLISKDREVEKIANATGMSGAHISKLMALVQLRENAVFDVKELADYLNITIRSAHRVIRKLLETGYAEVCGKESSGVGRPKSLIELHLDRHPDSTSPSQKLL